MKDLLNSTAKRWLLYAAEAFMVLLILGLLALIWLPTIVGARLGAMR